MFLVGTSFHPRSNNPVVQWISAVRMIKIPFEGAVRALDDKTIPQPVNAACSARESCSSSRGKHLSAMGEGVKLAWRSNKAAIEWLLTGELIRKLPTSGAWKSGFDAGS